MPWSDWRDLGGSFTGAPAVTSWGRDRIDVIGWARDTSNLSHNALTGGSWSGWSDLGGPVSSPPAAISYPGALNLVVRGMDRSVYFRTLTQGQWSDWFNMGGNFTREPWTPSFAKTGTRSSDVIGLGNDGAVYHRQFDGDRWLDWESTGGQFVSSPRVQPFIFGVFVKTWDAAENVWQNHVMGGRWFGWKNLGKEVTVPDAETFWIVGEQQVGNQPRMVVRFDQFVLQPDQNLWHQFYHRMNGDRGSEGAWENLGGPFEGAAAVSPFPGRVDLFATGTDGRIWHRVLTEAVA